MNTPNRFLLRYAGKSVPPVYDIDRIGSAAKVIDRSRTTVLVETDQPQELEQLISELPDWSVKPEQHYGMPTPVPHIKKRLY